MCSCLWAPNISASPIGWGVFVCVLSTDETDDLRFDKMRPKEHFGRQSVAAAPRRGECGEGSAAGILPSLGTKHKRLTHRVGRFCLCSQGTVYLHIGQQARGMERKACAVSGHCAQCALGNRAAKLRIRAQQSQTATFAYSPENPDSLGSL